nr:hypothetical protein [Tanacetum cinerariifolium]
KDVTSWVALYMKEATTIQLKHSASKAKYTYPKSISVHPHEKDQVTLPLLPSSTNPQPVMGPNNSENTSQARFRIQVWLVQADASLKYV